jgi:2-polyprenyl-3-methyl-5-hydroxy-6-metoxy-1,4-benzoquinol methylase
VTAERRRDSGRQSRPFYHEFAWAFDLIIDRPVERDCAVIVNWLVERGVVPGSTLLDAGCGTGRYARELARPGYLVHGIDVSLDLLEEAKRSARVHRSLSRPAISWRCRRRATMPCSVAVFSTIWSTMAIDDRRSHHSLRRFDATGS